MITPDMTFGQRLREFRKDRKLTQTKLAELAHVAHNTISNYEHDAVEAKFTAVVALADALEVDIEYLIPEYWHIKKENQKDEII